MSKVSGKKLNLTRTEYGNCYVRVKKSLKKTITRAARNALKRETRRAVKTV